MLINGQNIKENAVSSLIKDAREYQPQQEKWVEPKPLTTILAPEPYPLDALPDTLRNVVAEVQGFTKAPVALVASSALAALSVAAQALVDVERAEKLTGPTGLFLLSIADSGERKSTCDSFFTTAIREYEKQQAEKAKPLIAKHNAEQSAWDAQRSGISAAISKAASAGKDADVEKARLRLEEVERSRPIPPHIPKLIRGDDTPENLAWSLAREWPSAGVLSSEAGLILGAHAMGKDTIMRNLGLLNIFWDGGSLPIGRRTSESFTVRGARLTMGLQVQEATLLNFFERSCGLARGTGFLARFLVAWPESTQGTRMFTEAPILWPALEQFNQRLTALLETPAPLNEDGGLDPVLLRMTPEAKALWVTFHNAIERELCKGGELCDVRDVASKAADNAARLAALFHVLVHGVSGAIEAKTIDGANRLAAWHLNEARRFFGELVLPDEIADVARLNDWLVAWCLKERVTRVPFSTVQQFGPHKVRRKEKLNAVLHELEDTERARLISEEEGNFIHINPALIELGGSA